MKPLFFGFFLAAIIFLTSGCAAKPDAGSHRAAPKTSSDISSELREHTEGEAVKFRYRAYDFDGNELSVAALGSASSSISALGPVLGFFRSEGGQRFDSGQHLQILSKPAEQPIAKAILEKIASLGKDISNCKIKRSNILESDRTLVASGTEAYVIEAAKPIVYTKEELGRIAEREKDYRAEEPGPVNADRLREEFRVAHVVELCSDYAYNPQDLADPKPVRGAFYYNPSKSETNFIFIDSLRGPRLYQDVEILPE